MGSVSYVVRTLTRNTWTQPDRHLVGVAARPEFTLRVYVMFAGTLDEASISK